MREVKFRAWDRIQKQSMFDWEKILKTGFELFLKDSFGFVLMQFTGLKDKNGKEIYEGDIIKMLDEWIDHYELYSNHQIEFGSGCFRLENAVPLFECLDEDSDFKKCQFEVIGNIYEHSHLLNSAGKE